MDTDYVHASQQGDLEFFSKLLSKARVKNEELKKCYPKSGDYAVHFAVRHGRLNLLKFLDENGADLQVANLDGKKPLHEAAQNSQLPCLEYLLERGVTVDCLKRADWTPLMLACTKPSLPVIQTLIKYGADPRLKNKDGWNSLHIACREGDVSIVKYLLECDPDLWDTRSNNGRTPLHTAALHGCTDVTRHLLEHCGYKPDMTDSCGSTPLMDALRSQHIDMADLLISLHRADVSVEDNIGRQAIHLAAQSGAVDSLNYLIDTCGVDPGVKSRCRCITPLHLAAKEGHYNVLQLLISKGVDVNSIDDKGKTEWLNRVKFYNAEVFHDAVDKREPQRGLLTVCNHYSCMDDPLVWGMMKWRHVINANKVRWSTAAADICFTNCLNSLFFSLGQTIPICRGGGVYQKSMDYIIEELNRGGFVHIFPEGKVNMDKRSTRLKWGVGRIIADCKITPVVLPIYHIGMDDILPNSTPYIPRIRKNVTILVGKPMEFGSELEMLQKLKKNQKEIRKHITDIIQEELRILKEKAEQLHRTHFGLNEP